MTDSSPLFLKLLREEFTMFFEVCFETLEPGTRFQDYWFIQAVAHQLGRVARGEERRLIVNVPPRSGKSHLISIAYVAWRMGLDPRLRVICVSSDERLVRSLASSFKAVVTSDWYQRAFPAFRIARNGDRATETVTTERGYRYGVSIGGSILGRGADLIIADDAMSPAAALSDAVRRRELAFWDTAVRTRLNDKSRGAIIIVCQRLHQDDLVGHVTAGENLNGWTLLAIPAVETEERNYRLGPRPGDIYLRPAREVLLPDREPQSVLDEMRNAIGSMNYAAQYLQDPIPAGGNVIQRLWLEFYAEEPGSFDRLIVSWDTASTINVNSSFSVGQLWGQIGSDFYLLEQQRVRLETPALRKLILACDAEWEPDETYVEDTELGRSLVQDIRRTSDMVIRLSRPVHDKLARLLAQSSRFEAGQVHLPQDADWLDDYVKEILAAPFGKYWDQVDATTQALHVLTARAARSRPLGRRNIERRNIERR